MKLTVFVFVAAALLISAMAFSQIKPCEDLKGEIEKKIQDKGVTSFTLEIVANDDVKDQKVVGSCNGGKNKIVYTKEAKAKETKEAKEVKKAPEKKDK
jgi:hypothetical protein